MSYNPDQETFDYYSDRVVPYRHLETIARKFIKTYHCSDIYVETKTKDSCNRYLHLGKLANFNFLKQREVPKKQLSYKDWTTTIAE
jgi:hypothetical protein